MPPPEKPIIFATRGSALALVQTNLVIAQCRAEFPHLQFEAKIIKTTGDKMQTQALDNPSQPVAKGLFTKELEIALLDGEADLAVHSLTDLPTELPEGLILGAVSPREDVRDVLIYRDAAVFNAASGKLGLQAASTLRDFPSGSTIATSSTRRSAQLLALRLDLKIVPIRGNVGTRLQKLSDQSGIDGLVLAAAGLHRLNFRLRADGILEGERVPTGLCGTYLSLEEMLPCVGQGALGIEVRAGDDRAAEICRRLNDPTTFQCVTAERAFLRGMGGGCLSPVAAYGQRAGDELRLRSISFRDDTMRRAELRGRLEEAVTLGEQAARQLTPRA